MPWDGVDHEAFSDDGGSAGNAGSAGECYTIFWVLFKLPNDVWSCPSGGCGHSDCLGVFQMLEWRLILPEGLAGVSNLPASASIYPPAFQFESPALSLKRI